MSKSFDPIMIQTAGQRISPQDTHGVAVNDRSGHKRGSVQIDNVLAECRQAAFNRWLFQISYMLDEWEMELIGQAAPLSTFETIAAFKDILRKDV